MEMNKMQNRPVVRAGLIGSALLVVILILSLSPVNADLLNLKLSGPEQAHSNVHHIQISPNGQYALFLADFITENAFELYSVPIDGSEEPTLLSSGLLPTGAEVEGYRIAPNSSRVAYVADQDTAGMMELFSVPITGGPIVKLNPTITDEDGSVDSGTLAFSPDSSRVVFISDWETYANYELFSVPAAGGEATRLNGDLPMNGSLSGFEITPDGDNVVYVASQDDASETELYIVPITGGESVQLNGPLVAGGLVWTAMISPDGGHVVYTAEQDVAGQWEIFSVALTDPPGAPVQLNPEMADFKDVVYNTFRISADGSTVVYAADGSINDVIQFYSVPIGGGPVTTLTFVAAGAPILGGQYTFEISPDSSRLVYRVTYQGARQLYSVPLAGGEVVKLNEELVEFGHVEEFHIAPDSSRVVYLANQQDANSQELYSVPIAGGPVAKLNSALPWLGNVISAQISPDSERVVYVADQQVKSEYEIFSVPLADGDITRLNADLVEDGWVNLAFEIAPNSNHVVYVAEQETVDVRELFVTFEEMAPPPPAGSELLFIPVIQK
jgi:Tol biopolymer transport system component